MSELGQERRIGPDRNISASTRMSGRSNGHALTSAWCRYCCKSRFVPMIKNSAGRRFGFRVRMRGTSSPHLKHTGNFGNATEGMRIGDQFPPCVFAKNSEPCNFRLLQQNLPTAVIRSLRTDEKLW